MKGKNIIENKLNSFFELRFVPDPSILDKRGNISQKLISEMNVWSNWQINANTINLTGEINKSVVNGFFSYKNLGIQCFDIKNDEDYLMITKNYIKTAWNIISPQSFSRIGFRFMTLIPTELGLEEFTKDFIKRTLSDQTKKLVTKDISISLDSVVDGINLHIQIGPMGSDQALKYMSLSEAPKASVYVDTDISVTDFTQYKKQSQVTSLVDKAIEMKNKSLADVNGLLGLNTKNNAKQ